MVENKERQFKEIFFLEEIFRAAGLSVGIWDFRENGFDFSSKK